MYVELEVVRCQLDPTLPLPPNLMKKPKNPIWLTIASAIFVSSLCIDTVHARSGTPPLNKTGAPGHSTCTDCHTGGAADTGSVSLDFSGAFGEYEPGEIYTMMVTVADPTKVRFGFSMVARDADNNTVDVGTWAAGGPNTQVHGTGGSHASHLSAPFIGGGTHTFTVNWTAPATSVGDVTFYVAGNAANGGGTAGDNIYTSTLTITEQVVAMNLPPSVSVPAGAQNATTGLETVIAGVSISDDDAAGGDLTATLSMQDGILLIDDSVPDGVPAADITDNGTGTVILTGTLAELNATLGAADGLVYQSDPGFLGTDTLDVLVNDNGNTGPGGAMTGEASVSIVVHSPPFFSDLQFLKNGDFSITLNSVDGLTYLVERSEDLEIWVPHDQVTLVGPTVLVTDDGVAGVPSRFYRARLTQP